MEVRKLKKTEHHNTRKLWELVFTDDTNSFLDYYYKEKASENEIYVMEKDEEIQGMLQLNPYMLQMGKHPFWGHYIVAVATHPAFRKQGIMRQLLHRSLQDMYNQNEAFTFLMPAVEDIYLPFDFRFVYKQRQGKIQGKTPLIENVKIRIAKDRDAQMLADFANTYLQDKQVYAKRDANYYQCLIKEMQSENGGIVLIEERNILIGFYLYAKTPQYMIREPIFKKGKESYFAETVMLLTGNPTEEVTCIGYEGEMQQVEEKPMIMFRILHPEVIFATIRAKSVIDICVEIEDKIIKENNKIWKLCAKQGEYLQVSEYAGAADVKVSIAELASILFGVEIKEEFSAFESLNKIFLNEVV